MIFSKSKYLETLVAVLDVAVSVLVYLIVLNLYTTFRPATFVNYENHLGLLLFVVLAIIASRQLLSGELQLRPKSRGGHIVDVGKIMALAFAIVVSALFLFDLSFVSRLVFVGFFAANLVTLTSIRLFLGWWYFGRKAVDQDNFLRVLVVGSGRRAHYLVKHLQSHSEWGVKIIGFLDPDDPKKYNRRSTDNVLGHVDEITDILSANVVDEVVIAVPRRLLTDLQSIFDACQEEGVKLRYMADIYDFSAARVRMNMVGDIPLMSFEPVAQNERMLVVKRLTDMILTLASMVVILPLFALIALAIRIDSKGPAFFVQERVGLHKRKFRMFKFRTMVEDAEKRIAEVEHLNEAEGPNFKIAEDPRVTKLGRILRRTSIDELPQLFNVIIGDMSLVGPRPMSIRDVNQFDKGVQRKRFSVKPGITCLWQVSGRSDLSFDDWLRLDLEYIESWSFRLDVKILLMTVPAVLGRSGAV